MSYRKLVDMGVDLASRARARELREEFLCALGSPPHRLTFDFEGVRTLSDSFADELIAVLVEERGEVWFRENVVLANLSAAHRRVVLSCVRTRLSQRAARSEDRLRAHHAVGAYPVDAEAIDSMPAKTVSA